MMPRDVHCKAMERPQRRILGALLPEEDWFMKSEERDDAIRVLERAAEVAPEDRGVLLQLCDAYEAAHRDEDAAGVLEKIIASFGTERTRELALCHQRLAHALPRHCNQSVAMKHLDMALEMDPGSLDILRDIGVFAYCANDLERAQKTLLALLPQPIDPVTKGEVLYCLGMISVRQRDKVKAVELLKRAIETEPSWIYIESTIQMLERQLR